MKGISVYLRGTHMCNLNCKYCYDKPNRLKYGNKVLDLKDFDKLNRLLSKEYNGIFYIWHGGEPTCIPIDFYDKAQDSIFASYQTNIMQQIITNGIKFDENWINFSKNANFLPCFSYDGDNSLRGNISETLNKVFQKCKENNLNFDTTFVLNSDNISRIKEVYKASFNAGANTIIFNPIYSYNNGQEEYLLNKEIFYDNYIDFLMFLFEQEYNFEENSFRHIQVLLGKPNTVCTRIDCRYTMLGLSPEGTLFPCCGCFPEKYNMGKVSEIKDINEAFQSVAYQNYVNEIEEKLQKHCYNCNYFKYCNGGCHNSSIDKYGTASILDKNECDTFSVLFNGSYIALRKIETFDNIKNNNLREFIIRNKSFLPLEIKNSINKNLNIDYNFISEKDIQLDGLPKSKEFLILELINEKINNQNIINKILLLLEKEQNSNSINKENRILFLDLLVKEYSQEIKNIINQ